MSKKSGFERATDAARHIKAIKDIIKAFMQGGWGAAALQAVKHYWPQITAAALILTLLPVIIFCCLPMTVFGFGSSDDAQIASMTDKADKLSGIYDNYQKYIKDRIEKIKINVSKNTETQDTENGAEVISFKTVIEGNIIQKNWYVALHAVSVGNDLETADEKSIKAFADNCVSYSVTDVLKNTENLTEASDGAVSDKENAVEKLLTIRHLTPIEIMETSEFSEADRNWAQLIFKTLNDERNSSAGDFVSLFDDTDWRGHITSDYGYRSGKNAGFHHGIDIAKPAGTPILAVKDGVVKTAVFNDAVYGHYIILSHENGVETLYAHCSELLVSTGQNIKAKDIIAKVGNTGNSTGPHCHFEVRIGGSAVNPLPYLP